jgi:RimJ/RimL family protein N-acetyltransferase
MIVSVRLRPTTLADLVFVLETERDPDNARFILPWTREQHLGALADPDVAHRIIEHGSPGDRVGFVLLLGLTSLHGSLEFRRIVVTAKGRGLGRAAVRAVKQFAFVGHQAHRLWLDVKEFNARARHLYASEGFVQEGVLRECLRGESGFDSLVVLSMLASEYRPG